MQLANCCPDTTRTAPCPATLLTRLVRAHLQYKPETFEQLVYKETLSKLVHSVGYPKEVLKFELDHTYMVRGLAVDKERGNILKIDRHNYVKVAYHGWQELSSEERNATYNQAPFAMTFEEPYFALIDTLFSLGEAYLFAQLVDLIDGRPELFAEEKSYSQIYSDVRGRPIQVYRGRRFTGAALQDAAAEWTQGLPADKLAVRLHGRGDDVPVPQLRWPLAGLL